MCLSLYSPAVCTCTYIHVLHLCCHYFYGTCVNLGTLCSLNRCHVVTSLVVALFIVVQVACQIWTPFVVVHWERSPMDRQ